MSEQRQTYTLDASGQPLTVHQDGVTMPADHSFACVNDYVHDTGRHFEELQCLALGMACEIDKLRAEAVQERASLAALRRDAMHLQEQADALHRAAHAAGLPAGSDARALPTTITRLHKDAARYQFLRDQQALTADRATYAVMRWNERGGEWLHIDFKLDAEIDQAMEASQ